LVIYSSLSGSHLLHCHHHCHDLFIFLERKTPSISTDSALDHSHLARDAKTCKWLQNVCDTYANPLDKNR
jgi:hypothetical protein